jgi:NAD(P)-dependent dehydrogenase (short-subunit alcohol dehydrogenase family)
LSEFEDKVIVITGASQGIGRKHALGFSELGAIVCLLDINEPGLKKVQEEIANSNNKKSFLFIVDVSDSQQVDQAVNEIGKQFGRIDILINNAGILKKSLVAEASDEHWKLMLGVNLMGAVYCSRAVIPFMKENGGSIINVSSILGHFPNTGSAAYGVAKGGVSILTRVLAAELAPYNIRVNAYSPGVVNTPMAEYVIKNRAESKLKQIALRRFAEPKDIFDLVKFLTSSAGSYLTGQTIGIDGGIWITQTPTATWPTDNNNN